MADVKPTVKPLLSRPLDAVYYVWFIIHLIIMFCVDMTNIYPSWMIPERLVSLRTWYIATYNDRFFVAPPAWFLSFIWMEAIYHVPLSIWAIGALRKNHPLVPLHILIWSVQTFITTLVCVVDIVYWPSITQRELFGLSSLYVPYCLLAAFMGIDMFVRLRSKLYRYTALKRD